MPIEPGTSLAHYEILSLLGKGGMGEVFRAKDTKLGREVAIKILPEEFTKDTERLARFDREARSLAALSHSNVASIFEVGSEASLHYLVMELAGGADLSERLKRGPIPIHEAIAIAKQIAEALEAAHEKGIIHRDLKPANINVDDEGRVKVLDFGLAKALETDDSAEDVSNSPTMVRAATHAGVILGTAAYMSPEQARGKKVDKRADIWAFGVVLFEMLTGKRLFGGDTISDTLASVLKEEPDWKSLPPATPRSVHRLLGLCLEKNPRNRLHDIADARLMLEDAGEHSGEVSPAVPQKHARGKTWGVRLGWLVVGAIAATGVFLFSNLKRGSNSPTQETRPPRITLQRVTELPGPELQPTLSPDGRMVVYASGVSGNLDLYLVRVGGDRAIPLTTDPADDSQATFSPDGERIAFRSERGGGGLFVMGATGESVRRVTATGFDPAWSPDGKRIVYAEEPVKDPYSRQFDSAIWIVEVDTGKTSRLFAGDAVQPSWSPDGKRIAFWSNDDGPRDIKTISVSGGEPVSVTRDVATDWSPRWSPDGRWLYFSSDRGGSMNLWRIAIDSQTGKPSGEPQPITSGVQGLAWASFSGDGSRIAVMAYESSYEQTIYAIDPKGSAEARAVRVLRNPSASWCTLSPHGDWLACRTAGIPEDLVLVRADGGEMRRLTSDSAKDRNAKWDPAGERLIFMSTLSGSWEMWSIRVDGSDRRQLTRSGYAFGGWSPDGKYFLASETKSRFVVKIDVSTGEAEKLELDLGLEDSENFNVDSWSPGGNLVATSLADQSGLATSYRILDLGSGSVRTLDAKPVGRWFGSVGGWFPDSRHLLVRTPEGATVVDVESGRRIVVAPAVTDDLLSLSRDGKVLLVEKRILESDIWLIELK